MANVRDAYWDSLKLNLIFLVVLGHFLELHLHQHSDSLPALVLYSVVVTAVLAWLSYMHDNRLVRKR